MRSSLRSVKSMKELESRLGKDGWTVRKGKHHVWKCECGEHTVVLPQSGARVGKAFKNYVKHVDRSCYGH